jgi:hypothetical protein
LALSRDQDHGERSPIIAETSAMPMSDHTVISPFAPADNPAVSAHIDLLQGIINRLANNSSSCKTWCLTLTAAFLSLAGAIHQPRVVSFALVPVVIFGFLDAMYLAQERAYRELYRHITQKIRNRTYGLGDAYEAHAPLSFCGAVSTLWSWSIYPVYGGLLLLYVVAEWRGWIDVLTAKV